MGKIIGVINAAGTQVEQKNSGQPIRQADFGWVGWVAASQRGTPNKLLTLRTQADVDRQIGSIISESAATDAAGDFMKAAGGAGGILFVRVTDGNELQASIPIYQRKLEPTLLGYIKAANGGRWGGAAAWKVGSVADEIADITETTLDTGLTMKTDEWKGATLTLDGVPNKSYTVISNDTAGVLHVAADQEMASDLAANGDPTNDGYHLSLSNGTTYIGIRIGDGDTDPVGRWSLEVYLDGKVDPVRRWGDLSTDPDSNYFWETLINEDVGNHYITAVAEFEGTHTADTRPAAHYGQFTTLTNTTMTVRPYETVVDGSGNPTIAFGSITSSHIEQVITITMTGATAFTASSDRLGALGSGSFGVLFAAPNEWTPSFTISAGTAAMVAAEKIYLYLKPWSTNQLAGGYVYPDKKNEPRKRYRIVSNTANVVTVASSSKMLTDIAPVAGVAADGEITFSAQANIIDGEKFTLIDFYGVSVDFVFDQTGAYVPGGGYTSTVIRLDISGATTAQDVAVIARTAIQAMPASFAISAPDAPVAGVLALVQDLPGTAGNTTITETVVDAATIAVSFTGGEDPTENEFMVDYPRQLVGGRDGNSELTDAHYEAAWEPATTQFKKIVQRNLGLVKFATPGVTSASVQKAMLDLAELYMLECRFEIPSNITDEDDADDYVRNTLRASAYAVVNFPSYVYKQDPQQTNKLKLITATGMLQGLEAAYAKRNQGYHVPAAGVDAILSAVKKLPTGDEILDEEFLNPRGINVIKKYGSDFISWGDRTLQDDEEQFKFKHDLELMCHYQRVLLDSYGWIIFQVQNPDLRNTLIGALRAYFDKQWDIGALDRNMSRRDAIVIKIDAENNTEATAEAGELHAEIELGLAKVVEKFKIKIGKKGVTTTAA